jgi:hypothetical protein
MTAAVFYYGHFIPPRGGRRRARIARIAAAWLQRLGRFV